MKKIQLKNEWDFYLFLVLSSLNYPHVTWLKRSLLLVDKRDEFIHASFLSNPSSLFFAPEPAVWLPLKNKHCDLTPTYNPSLNAFPRGVKANSSQIYRPSNNFFLNKKKIQ